MTEVQERCTRQFVQNVKKSVKFLSSLEEIVQFTVKNAIPNEKIAAVNLSVYGRKE
jgi:hypothetical protein